jgi:hypothetical protein
MKVNWDRQRRAEPFQCGSQRLAQSQAENRTRQGQQQAFDQQLLKQSPPSRSQRKPRGQFPPPRRTARQ